MTIAIIGAGVMGETILAGLLKAGRSASEIIVADRRPARRAELADAHGVRVGEGAEIAEGADVVLFVVKPHDLPGVLADVKPYLAPDALVVSVCAGVPTALIEDALGEGQPVVRVMPNTPASVGQGMAAVSGGRWASDEHVATASDLMDAVGRSIVVAEKYQDAVTAISGSGPAYLFYVAEAMIDAGVLLGLPRDQASELVVQTLLGSAQLLRETGEHPTILRERVTSPGGTTAAGVRQLDAHAVKAAFLAAAEAARDRSAELAPKDR